FPGAPGISMSGGSLWLSDSTVIAGSGCAIEATGLVRIDRTALSTFGVGCAASPTGAPLVGVSRSGPLQIGTLFQVAVATAPGAMVLVCGSTRLAAPLLAAIVEQPIWLDPTLLFLADAAIAPPAGQTTFTYQVPPNTALVGEQVW